MKRRGSFCLPVTLLGPRWQSHTLLAAVLEETRNYRSEKSHFILLLRIQTQGVQTVKRTAAEYSGTPPPSERRARDLSGWALSRRTWSRDSRTALAISVFVLTAPENLEYLLRVPWLDHPLRGGGERRCIASSCWGYTLKGHKGPQPLFLFISCCAYRKLLCSPHFPGQSWSVVTKS